ncbi:MAG TPA: GNAT family N-acetyltransferase [Ktedonobacterales bacterium]|nr:GNAT family N-acetyltransferase [Ktedonobacterales bacterium]
MIPDELLPGITVRPATPADAAACVKIHEDAARWLWARGIRQWRPGVFQFAWLEKPIARGWLFVAERAGEPIAMAMIEPSDEEAWPDAPDDAGYIHFLRVLRSAAGQGIGAALLDWAERQIAASGKPFARLDCIADNPDLRAYYERAGYILVDVVPHDEGGELARFEKRIDGMMTETIPTPYGILTIRTAGPGDVDALVAIDESVSAWMESRGIDAGPRPEPPRALTAERAGDGTRWLALLDGQPAGMMRVLWQPEALWADLPDDAAYVHGLMVHRDFAGKEIGRRLLEWAERRASAASTPLVRLDCMAENPELRAYYERAGYAHRGDVTLPHRTAARYEKSVQSAVAGPSSLSPRGVAARPASPLPASGGEDSSGSPSPRRERGPGGEDTP